MRRRLPRGAVVRVRRLASPTALALTVGCLVLPFLGASCSTAELDPGAPADQQPQWRVTYTGLDVIAGGQPDLAYGNGELQPVEGAGLTDMFGELPAPLPPQPLGWLALALVLAALAVTGVRRPPLRAALTGGLALTAALLLYAATLLAREQAIDTVAEVLRRFVGPEERPPTPIRDWEYYSWVRGRFRFGYGFWAAVGALVLVGMANVVGAVPGRRPPSVATPTEPDSPARS